MTPVLPCFTGFVPYEIASVFPNASVVNGSAWNGFPSQYTNDTFLEPFDPLFEQLQTSFIQKQTAAYGNVSHIYTLDQYNENSELANENFHLVIKADHYILHDRPILGKHNISQQRQ